MYGSAQQEAWRQRPEEMRQEVAATRLEKNLRANHETRPYVVRDLSWELARFLDSETFPASTFAATDGANGTSARPE